MSHLPSYCSLLVFLDMVFYVSLVGFLCNLLTSGIIGKHLRVLLNAFFLFWSIPDVFNSKLTVKWTWHPKLAFPKVHRWAMSDVVGFLSPLFFYFLIYVICMLNVCIFLHISGHTHVWVCMHAHEFVPDGDLGMMSVIILPLSSSLFIHGGTVCQSNPECTAMAAVAS